MGRRFDYLVWDWNGTLFADVPVCIAVMNGMLEKRGLRPIADEAGYRGIFCFPVCDYYRKAGFDFAEEPFETLAQEYISAYHQAAEACSLYPEARVLLEKLKARGYRQLLVSASRQDALDRQVRPFGILPCFEAVLGMTDCYAAGKSGLAQEWLRQCGADPARVLFIGDTVHDWEVARENGCACVLLADGHQSPELLRTTGAPVLNSLAELPDYLSGICLRPLTEDDAEVVFSMTSDPEVVAYMRFGVQRTLAEARKLVGDYISPGNDAWLVTEREDGAAVGMAALKRSEEGCYGLSLFLARRAWGKGYGTELFHRLTELGRAQGAKRLSAHIVGGNLASRRAAEQAGFAVEQILRFDDLPEDLYVYVHSCMPHVGSGKEKT